MLYCDFQPSFHAGIIGIDTERYGFRRRQGNGCGEPSALALESVSLIRQFIADVCDVITGKAADEYIGNRNVRMHENCLCATVNDHILIKEIYRRLLGTADGNDGNK